MFLVTTYRGTDAINYEYFMLFKINKKPGVNVEWTNKNKTSKSSTFQIQKHGVDSSKKRTNGTT